VPGAAGATVDREAAETYAQQVVQQADSVEFTTLEALDDRARDRVEAIYDEAFPVRQREPFADLLSEHSAEPKSLAFIAVRGGVPIGFSFLSRLPAARHLYATYFAVHANARGAGVGRALWGATCSALREQGDTEPIVLEVEHPDEDGLTESDVVERRRRIEFWRRLGAQMLLEEGYAAPNFDGPGAEPMCLMRFGEDRLGSSGLLALIVALYTSGYGLDDRDPLVLEAYERWG